MMNCSARLGLSVKGFRTTFSQYIFLLHTLNAMLEMPVMVTCMIMSMMSSLIRIAFIITVGRTVPRRVRRSMIMIGKCALNVRRFGKVADLEKGGSLMIGRKQHSQKSEKESQT